MAMTEAVAQPHDRSGRPGRRRPFSALMKKLANLKAASTGDGSRYSGSKRSDAKKRQNNPYPQSGHAGAGATTSPPHSHYSLSSGPSRRLTSVTSLERDGSASISLDEHPPPTTGGRSVAPTVSTEHDACRSIIAPSHGGDASLAGTSRTINGRRGGGDSTFSSPAPSVRSLTTTLTTIQTVAPNTANGGGSGGNSVNQTQSAPTQHHHHNHHHHAHHNSNSTSQVIHFNQPFPTTASPASAIPPHLATTTTTTTTNGSTISSPFHPTTYATATANNLLTDNASILTLASSSKRRRRRSFDTDASVRALAPSSLWGGSRESLPLSVLSATLDAVGPSATTPTGGGAAGGVAGAGGSSGVGGVGVGVGVGVRGERTSIYSATGILMHGSTAAASERSSFYAKHREQQLQGGGLDAASVRSGLLGHGRADSVTGSIGGGLSGSGGGGSGGGAGGAGSLAAGATGTSPLASPREEGEVAEKEAME